MIFPIGPRRNKATTGKKWIRFARTGFTLIELLLVVVITLLAAGIAMPSFVRSFQSSKLRTSARAVVMIGKYARSMSVLEQKQMAVLFDKAIGRMEVVTISGMTGASDRDKFLEGGRNREAEALLGDSETAAAAEEPIQSDLVRNLADGVQIEKLEVQQEGQSYDNIYWINFYPNGMCDGFELRLVDAKGKSAEVSMDAISGTMKVEYEQ